MGDLDAFDSLPEQISLTPWADDVIRVTHYRDVPGRPDISQWWAFPPSSGLLEPLSERDTDDNPGWSPGNFNPCAPTSDLGAGCGRNAVADDISP